MAWCSTGIRGSSWQLPFAVVGLVGLWLARKKFPAAVLATVASVGAILILNGTYISNPYGGLSLAGRFMWTLMPVMIFWIAMVLARWQEAGRLLWAPVIVVGLAWFYQAKPILQGDHSYYNMPPPWDPAAWPSWWQGLSNILPQYDLAGRPLGAPAFALAVEVGIAVIVVIAACEYMKPDNFSKWSMATMGGLAALVLIALVAARPLLPTTTLRYDAMQLGAPVTGGDQPSNSPDVVLQGVLPGTYRFTLSYALMGSGGSGALIVSCNSASGAAPQSVSAGLNPSHVTKTVQLRCNQPGTVSAQLSVGAHSVLHVGSLRLQKIAA